MQYDFAVIGGDRRQIYLANDLKNRRYRVIVYGGEKVSRRQSEMQNVS